MRKTILIIFRAALLAGLLSLWSPFLEYRWPALSSFPYPGSDQFWETLVGEKINPGTDEGSLTGSWWLGPLVVTINLLTWLPLTAPVSLLIHRRRVLVRGLGVVLLLAGFGSIIAGCWEFIPYVYFAHFAGFSLGENYFFYFAALPTVTLGALSAIESAKMLRTPQV